MGALSGDALSLFVDQTTKLPGDCIKVNITNLSSILSDNLPAHASTHSDGGSDQINVENLGTANLNVAYALKPDGAGGLTFGAVGGGSVFAYTDAALSLYGTNNTAPGGTIYNGIQIGVNASIVRSGGIAIGYNATALQNGNTAIGYNAYSSSYYGTTIGANSNVSYYGSTAVGYYCNTNSIATTGVGAYVSITGYHSIGIGYNARIINGDYNVMIGRSSLNGSNNVFIGTAVSVTNTNDNSVIIGGSGNYSNTVAIGYKSIVGANGATTVGYNSRATGSNAVAIGNGIQNAVASSIKMGWANTAGNYIQFADFSPNVGVKTGTHSIPVTLNGATYHILLSNV